MQKLELSPQKCKVTYSITCHNHRNINTQILTGFEPESCKHIQNAGKTQFTALFKILLFIKNKPYLNWVYQLSQASPYLERGKHFILTVGALQVGAIQNSQFLQWCSYVLLSTCLTWWLTITETQRSLLPLLTLQQVSTKEKSFPCWLDFLFASFLKINHHF